MAAAFELITWSVLGLAAGFLLHLWKSNVSPHPECAADDEACLALADYPLSVNVDDDHDYDEGGYWDYFSLRNLRTCLVAGVVAVLGPVYATTQSHEYATNGFCQVAGLAGLTPVFCVSDRPGSSPTR